ncbi:polymeric immunoglobulin receptor-like [Anguilla anguilla]|uniref:polymeric immunoglobulin receptor-like n=1 Tax=Anguilla anguilla TaxID=7936 RepID=UPI0015B277AC|nr:polymeric immunoglobulin receptor-like [Anguilla anguilla]
MLKRAEPSYGYTHTHTHTQTSIMHMATTQLLFLSIIFLPVLPGAGAVSTVSNVAVQTGRSATIPCHYDKKYEKHVKYWCRWSDWNTCHTLVRTDSPEVEGETSITDDPTHHVFTVTMTKLTGQDTGYYWCCVDIDWYLDDCTYLHLSVTAEAPGLWVDQQEVTGVEGGHVSMQCHYNEPSSMKKWCRAEGSCVEVNSAKSGRSEIKYNRSKKVFIVTMRELNREDPGWYWCAAGELQIPVHITVTQKTTTTTVTTTTQSSTSRPLCTSLPVSTATTSATAEEPSTSKQLAVTIPRSSIPPTTTYSKRPSDLIIVLMTSGILLLAAAVATVTWKLWKKHKSVQANTRAREDRRNEVTTEVTYSTVFTKTRSSSHRMSPPQSQSSESSADEVMYCSVILQNPQATHSPNQSPARTAEDVIYSSIAQQKMQEMIMIDILATERAQITEHEEPKRWGLRGTGSENHVKKSWTLYQMHTHTSGHHTHMAPIQLLFLSIIFLSVLPGADAVSTVSKVAVQRGRSVTIPCHYHKKYEKHVKYWCRGSGWNTCRTVVRTDSPKVEGETSITDDPTHHVFAVTMTKLKTGDSGYYWCCVEINLDVDEGTLLYLSVTAEAPGLWVDRQEVTGVEGGHVSVQCHTNYPSSMKKWCRAEGTCVEVNSAKSGRAEFQYSRSKKAFIVTMRELKREDTGWYWCATGELQIPVHITVSQKTTTTTVTTTTQCATSTPPCTSLPVSTATTSDTAEEPSTSKQLAVTIPRSSIPPTTTYNKSLSDLTFVLMISGILLLAAAVATITWKLWKKHKSIRVNARAREDRRNEVTQTVDSEDEATYSTVFTKTQSSSHRMSPPQSQSSESSADEVIYCSVILQNPQATHSPNQSPAGTADDVIYSSVAQQKK